MPIQAMPDYTKYGTLRAIKKELGFDFELTGPGLYCTDTDTLLIVDEANEDPWEQPTSHRAIADRVYTAMVWNITLKGTLAGELSIASDAKIIVDRRGRIEWTPADDAFAKSRGWALFNQGKGTRLQALDDQSGVEPRPLHVFKGPDRDLHAIAFVQALADAGEPVCRKAINFLFAQGTEVIDYHQVQRNW